MDPDQRCPTFQSFRGPNFCGQSDDNSEWHSEGFEVSIKYLDIYGKYVTMLLGVVSVCLVFGFK